MVADRALLVVVNAAAGSAGDGAVDAALAVLRRGADVEVVGTRTPADLDEVVAAAGDRRLVVVGGDGSLSSVATALDRAGVLDAGSPLGVVPAGTGNDLARALGLPLDPEEAAAVVLGGVPRRLDVLDDDAGGLVVNAVHAGIGARAGARAAGLKAALGAAAYPVGAVAAGVAEEGWPLRVEVDGAVVTAAAGAWAADGDRPVLMAGVCNGPSIGGGSDLAPDADPGDGLLDVVVSVATGPVARAGYAAALAAGSHLEREDVIRVRGRAVRLSGAPVDLDADGEIEEAVPARTWTVRPAAWSLVVPA
ncbi:diacylglycerol/lipid kinase family protein [Geodermatophilus marinus]|uniref:diacylglycerol/lipid kinase family protein n=1 Tax=Geodermatophilus sp. LHW52908 TaxID=2303986 RepID=UPI000E3E864C|nr:diacylglycerol kinase family protein [Geodermatophilus sp. LHW52908]RFU23498.1 diacylglycerol kinase [Geodermatophilus sp. LHW52908]